jgi:dipeptidase E
MTSTRRILAMGGHDFDRRPGNQALCDQIVELAGSAQPRICLLPTASGDAAEQIARFRRCFGERDCRPSEISLFRLGEGQLDLRGHLLAQDAIYVGGGSLLNLLAIWRAHELEAVLREAWEEEILIVGQSAGAMCWFEGGVTKSSGPPAPAEGLGLLPGSASVHYHSEPERRRVYFDAIQSGALPPGLGIDDQAAVLYEDTQIAAAFSARPGAGVWSVTQGAIEAHEEALETARLLDAEPALGDVPAEVIELRQTLEARATARRARRSGSGPGRF